MEVLSPNKNFDQESFQLDKKSLQKKYTGNWIWRAVGSMVGLKDHHATPGWIASRLNVPFEKVLEALQGLEELGIIRRTSNGYEKVLKYVYFSDRQLDPKTILADHVLISSQIHGRLDPLDPNSGCFYRTGFLATNRKLALEFFTKMENLMKEFLVESSKQEVDSIYSFTFSAVDVAKNTIKKEDSK